MEFTSRWTSTKILTTTMKFSPDTEERRLTLGQINERWRKRGMKMINGRWHLCLCRFPLLEKESEELSYPFCSVQCPWLLVRKKFGSLTWELFCRWIEIYFCPWSLLSQLTWSAVLFCFPVNSKFLLPGFLSLISSLQAVVVLVFTNSVLLFPRSISF